MAHLHKKVKHGRTYYYVRETQRIDGKPTVVHQVYLGTADKILARVTGRELPRRFASKEFGALFVLNVLDRTTINLAHLIDTVLPARRKPAQLSLGQSLYYAVLNRAIAPRSKRQLAQWYETTDIQHIRPVRLKSLSPQHLWNQWDRLEPDDLERIAAQFFQQVQAFRPCHDEHFLFDTTNYYTYLDSQTPSTLAKRGYNKAGKHHLRQVGLALITERSSGLPVYYQPYPGNQHDARFFEEHLPAIMTKMTALGLPGKALTLIFDKGLPNESTIGQMDATAGLHFITSYSPSFAPQLARIPLTQFQPLPSAQPADCSAHRAEDEPILYTETSAVFWGQARKVVIIYNPKTFRKKRYELREKLDKVRQVLYDLRRKHRDNAPHWKKPSAIRTHYEQLCESLHLSPNFFTLSFYTEDGRPQMAFHLNRYQTETHLRRLAKTILLTDHQDWSATDIYQAYRERHRIEAQFRQAKSPFQVALMPQYHWTDSKIRIHVLVCVMALTYLTLLRHRLVEAGLSLSIPAIMEALRSLRTALYWLPNERTPRRQLEEPTPTQLTILDAFGVQVQDGRVLQR
jgi:transposase